MAYELRALRRQKVRYNSANTDNPLWFTLVDDSSKTAMASGDAATITIYAPGNSTALVEDGDMTETIGSSVITYSPDTTTTASWPVGEGYRADVTVAISGGLTFTRHFVFDVVKYPLVLPMTRDQLVDRSDLIDGMEWAGDGDFIGILEACRDELQLKLEGLAYLHGRVLEDMALDASKLAVVWRPYVLEAIYREKGMTEKADYYLTRANELWDLYSAQVRFDTGQDGEEDSSPTRLVKTRFYT